MFKMYATFFVAIILSLHSDSGALIEVKDVQHKNSSLRQSGLCIQRPMDCSDIFENGFNKSGVYEIYPKSRSLSCSSFKVYCDMETDRGGWTVIQRRGDFNMPIDNFYKTWNEYKNGFGSLKIDFWLGNDFIHALTNQKKYSVRFDLGFEKETAYAVYDSFWIDNEEYRYKLHISGYRGNAGDSMSFHNNSTFSANDKIDINSCSILWKGGWWYGSGNNICYNANLNGLYMKGIYEENIFNGTTWKHWKGYKVSLSDVEIKIRPYDF